VALLTALVANQSTYTFAVQGRTDPKPTPPTA
jgi:hypothetical protein